MQICIYEDNYTGNFEPLSHYRPVFELVCGISTLREKIQRSFPEFKSSVFCRDYLANIMRERNPGLAVNNLMEEDYLFINGRILADDLLKKQLVTSGKDDILFLSNGIPVAAKISALRIHKIQIKDGIIDFSSLNKIKTIEISTNLIKYSFELISHNRDEILQDLKFANNNPELESGKFNGVHFVGKKDIIIGSGTVLKPGVVLDASEGPIVIGSNVLIYPNSVIEGPVSIGNNSLIKSCSTVYSNVRIGNVCKVGGEIEDMIMLDYSNKQHSGFIGHAYLGSWVNLGADTNCSDLKNNYSSIRIILNGKEVDTGLQFLGLIMGDHSKSAINTMFNTGTVAGFSANIYGAGFPNKFIPSFSWGGSEGFTEYKVDKSIETARKVFDRRNIQFTPAEDELFKNIFHKTAMERMNKEKATND